MERERCLMSALFITLFVLLAVSVRSQPVVCKSNVDCNGDDLGVMSARECCVNNPEGLSFTDQDTEMCTACIVYGFFQDTFVGIEQGASHMLQVGYQKGGAQSLLFNVVTSPGTARQSDYALASTEVRIVVPSIPDTLSVMFYVDDVAQEPNETLTLTLDPRSPIPTGNGVFFQSTSELTIIDSDIIELSFTEEDYRQMEFDPSNPSSNALMPVFITKNSLIASQIILEVIPLTVEEAKNRASPFLSNYFLEDNPNSPPFADLNDFNNSRITVIFGPDEDVAPMFRINALGAPIPIFDDIVNEAKQMFIVELQLVSSINPATVDLSRRPVSLCRIVDNDPIRIGFELPVYIYTEPPLETEINEFFVSPTGSATNGPIYFIKENNGISEQTFVVNIQLGDAGGSNAQPASLGEDYRQVGPNTAILFPPNESRVVFRFVLLADTLTEGTEVFMARISSSGEFQNTFFPPISLSSEIFIMIEDDDRIVIGFVNTSYTVAESVGMIQVDVQVFTPPVEQSFGSASIPLVIQTVSGSATGANDYQEIEAGLVFDDRVREGSFVVFITDDSSFEDTEHFELELRFDPLLEIQLFLNIELTPDIAVINIVDNDEIVIGFLDSSYTVSVTDNGLANVQIGVINGSIETTIVISFFITDSSQPSGNRVDEYRLNSTATVVELLVAVTDYVFEFSESVVANISFPEPPFPRAFLAPQSTLINIDVIIVGFTNNQYIVNESGGNVTLTMGVRGGANQCNESGWMVYLNLTSLSAQLTEDYSAFVPADLIYVSTTRQASVTVPIIDDALLELNETFQAEIEFIRNEDSNCVVLQPSIADITIVDDDEVVIGVIPDHISVTEGIDRFINLTVELLSGELGIDAVVAVHILPNSAINESDFIIHSSQYLTFGPNVNSYVLSVEIINDDLFETMFENFSIALSSNISNLQLDPSIATITIQDNDTIVLGFNSTTYDIAEGAGSVLLTIGVQEGQFGENVTISVRLSTFSVSARASLDYEESAQVLNFSRAMAVQTVSVRILEDEVLEIDEVFTVELELVPSENDDHSIFLQPNVTRVTILDNDTVVIGFMYENYTVSEGIDLFNDVTVELISGQLGQEVMVTLNTESISATGGTDFSTITDYQLTFNPNVSSITVPITISSDGHFEETELFLLILSTSEVRLQLTADSANLGRTVCQDKKIFSTSNDTARRAQAINIDLDRVFVSQTKEGLTFSLASTVSEHVRVSPAVSMVTLLDNDTIIVGFNSTNYYVNECEGQVHIKIEVIGSLQRAVVIHLSTNDLTATADINYQELSNRSLTFDPSNTESTVNILIIATNETLFEEDEEFIVNLSFPGEPIPRVVLEPDNATVTIFEINGQIGFTSDQDIVLEENIGTVNLMVGLISGTLCGEVAIEVSILNDTSDNTTAGEDYIMVTDSPVILTTELPNATITIFIIDDNLTEPIESIEVHLSFPGGPLPRIKLEPNTTTVTILASDSVMETGTETIAIVVTPADQTTLIGGVLGAVSFILIISILLLLVLICWFIRRLISKKPNLNKDEEDTYDRSVRGMSVQSSFKLNLPPNLIIHSSNIKMTETIGQGEFGVVYKGHLLKDQGKIITATVAVKTLKGFYDQTAVRDMLKECSKMNKFDHPNVLNLIGVCLDGGPAPFIIMPFMTNGSLLTYLKKNRATLVVSSESKDSEEVNVICKQLMDMCIQVARGMEYLAKMKVVHRDLAARNCMIDMNFVIKVADFGLAESVETKEYFRQDKSSTIKLPLKWLAPESLEDYIFSEKSDVWAYGVTCWEIFTAGKVPYATVNLPDLSKLVNNGHRLEKPTNLACTDEMYGFMLQCWDIEPKNRPTFSDLVGSLSQSLEAMAAYMDIGAFGSEVRHKAAASDLGTGISLPQEDHTESHEKECKAFGSQKVILQPAMASDETSL